VGDTGFTDYDTGETISPYTDDDDNIDGHPTTVYQYSDNRKKIRFQGVQEGAYAWQIAKSFLQSYKPNVKGYSLVMVVGSEYSAWLEKVRGLNILTSTKDSVQYYVMNLGAKL
jgi:hypothetical protein